jgi:hypothetical protein
MDLQDDRDPLLELWVHQADGDALSGLEVTLMVGGLLVSGRLVGIHHYVEGVANQFRNAPAPGRASAPRWRTCSTMQRPGGTTTRGALMMTATQGPSRMHTAASST